MMKNPLLNEGMEKRAWRVDPGSGRSLWEGSIPPGSCSPMDIVSLRPIGSEAGLAEQRSCHASGALLSPACGVMRLKTLGSVGGRQEHFEVETNCLRFL